MRYANHSGWYTSHALVVPACEPLYGAQLRIESDQPLTFSDQHSPRLSALAQVRKKLVPNFLCVWYVALCPTTLLCVLILHLVWMCAGMGESTSDKSSLHMDLYTKVWFQ